MSAQSFISYQDLRTQKTLAQLLLSEIPETNAVSFAIPSKRLGEPAFVQFSAPAYRVPRKPVLQGAPDRWWGVHAVTGKLLFYALWKVQPFHIGRPYDNQELPRVEFSIDQYHEKLLLLESQVNSLVPAFFLNQSIPLEQKSALWETYRLLIPGQLIDQYQMLAPDFFAWLIT